LCGGSAAGAEVERPGSSRGGCQGTGVLGHVDQGPWALHTGSPTFGHHDIEGAHAVVRPQQARINSSVPQQGSEGEPQGLGRWRHAVSHR